MIKCWNWHGSSKPRRPVVICSCYFICFFFFLALIAGMDTRTGTVGVAAAAFPTTAAGSMSAWSSIPVCTTSTYSTTTAPIASTATTSAVNRPRRCHRPVCFGNHHHHHLLAQQQAHGRRRPVFPASSSSYSSSALRLHRDQSGGHLIHGHDNNKPAGVFSRSLWTRLKASKSASDRNAGMTTTTTTTTTSLATSSAALSSSPETTRLEKYQQEQEFLKHMQSKTLLRVFLPSLAAGALATALFPGLALFLASYMNDGVFTILSQDSSQFVQNFLNVSSLLFSILVGQTYSTYYMHVGMFGFTELHAGFCMFVCTESHHFCLFLSP
jgi:hypothetical protein